MVDEQGKVSLELLGKNIERLLSDMAEVKQNVAHIPAMRTNIEELQVAVAAISVSQADLRERMEKTEATTARGQADASRNIGKMHVDMLSMHTDILEAKAASREVVVRLTNLDKLSAQMDGKIDKIYGHLGLIDA